MLLCFPRMKIVGLVSPQPCLLVRLISCHLFAPGSLKSGTPNFWKTEGAQKVTFSIQNLYSQMHFRSHMCPGGHLEGFEACLKRRSELRTWARNLFVPGSLKSGTLNFWKMEGAQKVTFSILNLSSQMYFRSQI